MTDTHGKCLPRASVRRRTDRTRRGGRAWRTPPDKSTPGHTNPLVPSARTRRSSGPACMLCSLPPGANPVTGKTCRVGTVLACRTQTRSTTQVSTGSAPQWRCHTQSRWGTGRSLGRIELPGESGKTGWGTAPGRASRSVRGSNIPGRIPLSRSRLRVRSRTRRGLWPDTKRKR